MAKKPTATHFTVKLGRAVRHPDHPEVLLSPKNTITVSAEVKDKLGDAVIEATPIEDGEV